MAIRLAPLPSWSPLRCRLNRFNTDAARLPPPVRQSQRCRHVVGKNFAYSNVAAANHVTADNVLSLEKGDAMMKFRLHGLIALGLTALLLCGCKRGETPPPAQAEEQAQPAASAPQGQVLFQGQREALEKAKAVEGQLRQQAQDQEKAIDAAQK